MIETISSDGKRLPPPICTRNSTEGQVRGLFFNILFLEATDYILEGGSVSLINIGH